MRPSVGNRDTLVTILTYTEVINDDFGTSEKSWTQLGQEWCEVRDVLPSRGEEQINSAINVAKRPTRVRMLYRSDLRSDMRLEIRGEVYEIVAGPAVLGRYDGLEVMCELFSVEGGRP